MIYYQIIIAMGIQKKQMWDSSVSLWLGQYKIWHDL